ANTCRACRLTSREPKGRRRILGKPKIHFVIQNPQIERNDSRPTNGSVLKGRNRCSLGKVFSRREGQDLQFNAFASEGSMTYREIRIEGHPNRRLRGVVGELDSMGCAGCEVKGYEFLQKLEMGCMLA